jgi:hypothetical protein
MHECSVLHICCSAIWSLAAPRRCNWKAVDNYNARNLFGNSSHNALRTKVSLSPCRGPDTECQNIWAWYSVIVLSGFTFD